MIANPNANNDAARTQVAKPAFWDREHPFLLWIGLSIISSVIFAFFLMLMK